MANIIIFGSLPKPNSVHFLPNITIPQVHLTYMCVFSYSHIKNAIHASIHTSNN